MLERARDKLPLVRAQAVHALARLQDPTDKDCPIIKGEILVPLLCNISLFMYLHTAMFYSSQSKS